MDDNWKNEITTPALVLDYNKMMENINTMAKFAKEHDINHRPHVKTHKCPIIAHLQLKAGCKGITVAKVGEAEVFAQSGIDDIFIANQVIVPNHIDRFAKLNKYIKISCAVDSQKNILDLSKIAAQNNTTLKVFLDINLGLGRSGVEPGEPALEMARFIEKTPNIDLVGLFGYEGHLTPMMNLDQKEKMANECFKMIVDTRDLLNENGFEIKDITTSGSGTYRYAVNYDGITEIRPGTYVFSDEHLDMVEKAFKIAVTILGTIQNQTGKKEFTTDAGAKAIATGDGKPEFKDFPRSKIRVMNEEHTQFKAIGLDKNLEIGQKIEFYPAHICTTINLHDHIHVIKDNEYVGTWEILARGKSY
jgi:D-serine deaminase-like pyridoxal phosphate-dependent protein